MLSRAQSLLSSPGPDNTYTSYQYPYHHPPGHRPGPLIHSSSSPMLSAASCSSPAEPAANTAAAAQFTSRSSPGIAETESMQM